MPVEKTEKWYNVMYLMAVCHPTVWRKSDFLSHSVGERHGVVISVNTLKFLLPTF